MLKVSLACLVCFVSYGCGANNIDSKIIGTELYQISSVELAEVDTNVRETKSCMNRLYGYDDDGKSVTIHVMQQGEFICGKKKRKGCMWNGEIYVSEDSLYNDTVSHETVHIVLLGDPLYNGDAEHNHKAFSPILDMRTGLVSHAQECDWDWVKLKALKLSLEAEL